MKNLVVVLIIFFFFAFYMECIHAAPVGSPASLLKKGQWDLAIESAYISGRPLESSGNTNFEVDIFQGYHSRSYGLTDRLMITGRAGGTYGYIDDESTPGADTRISLSGGFGLGLQLKGIIWENKDAGLEWDGSGQFLYLRSHHKRSGKADADWYEWQIATSFAKKLGRFKPYLGVKFSTVDLDHDDGKGNKTSYDEDGSVGPFLGTDIYLGQDKDIVINLEASFLLGNEFFGAIKYRF